MSTRRTVLKSIIATGSVAIFSGAVGTLSSLAASAVPIRRSLHGMALNDPDLSTYRDFVGLMLGKDQSKPLSWLGYSLQHGVYGGGFKYCPHGDWYFLPWHRGYVSMYEQAARELMKNPSFAMPYWDWTVDRTMPSAFTDSQYNGKSNPLYVAGRTLSTSNWPLKDSVVGPAVMQSIYAETVFQRFGTSKNPAQNSLDMSWVVRGGGTQGTLEANPHNNIHNFIGMYMPTAGSPRDPIFMMHHGNIDRIWAYWNGLGRSNTSGMDSATANLWLKMNFANNYIDSNGNTYGAVVQNLQSTTALGYTYDNLPPKADGRVFDPERNQRLTALFELGSSVKSAQVFGLLPDVENQAATLTAPLSKTARLHPATRDTVLATAPTERHGAEVFALLREIELTPGIESLKVFVNAPSVSPDTPESDPHFVTRIGFFAHGEHDAHHKAAPSILVDLTDTLRRLATEKLLGGESITVQLLPELRAGSDPEAERAVPASVEIGIL